MCVCMVCICLCIVCSCACMICMYVGMVCVHSCYGVYVWGIHAVMCMYVVIHAMVCMCVSICATVCVCMGMVSMCGHLCHGMHVEVLGKPCGTGSPFAFVWVLETELRLPASCRNYFCQTSP